MELKDYFKLPALDSFDYEYGIIDANYILFRNMNQLASYAYPEPILKEDLLRLTLQSFMKLKREYNFRYPLLLWDSSPYHKITAIENYKADRYIPTDEEYQDLESKKETEDLSPEELAEIEEQQVAIRTNQANFEIASTIKYEFISDYDNTGFNSVIKKGYEADDLAWLIASYLNEELPDTRSILLTADKDWVNFKLPNIDFISTFTKHSYPKLDEMWENDKEKLNTMNMSLYNKPCEITRYEYGILCEISGESHNNVAIFDVPDYDWYEFACRTVAGDKELPNFEIVRAAYEAMNMNIGVVPTVLDDNNCIINERSAGKSYRDDTINLIKFKLNNNTYASGVFEDKMNKELISINFSSYFDFVKGLDRVTLGDA